MEVDEPNTAVDLYGALPSVEIRDGFLPDATGTARTRRRSRRLPGAGGPVCGGGERDDRPEWNAAGMRAHVEYPHEAGPPAGWQNPGRRPGSH